MDSLKKNSLELLLKRGKELDGCFQMIPIWLCYFQTKTIRLRFNNMIYFNLQKEKEIKFIKIIIRSNFRDWIRILIY